MNPQTVAQEKVGALFIIYSDMKDKVQDLNVLLAEAVTELRLGEKDDPTHVLAGLHKKHTPERVEALVGEIVDLLHQEQSKAKSISEIQEMPWAEYKKWMEDKGKEIVKELGLMMRVRFQKDYLDSSNSLIPFGYNADFGNGDNKKDVFEYGSIKIRFLELKFGKLFSKTVTNEHNFNQAKLEKPQIVIILGYFQTKMAQAKQIEASIKDYCTRRGYKFWFRMDKCYVVT